MKNKGRAVSNSPPFSFSAQHPTAISNEFLQIDERFISRHANSEEVSSLAVFSYA